MKIIIDLDEIVLEQLQWMADRDQRSRKKLIELLLRKAAEEYTPKNPKWPKEKN
jgi:metal-responsive CopG/Arc/MetJ family transcriptional regulator